MVSQTQFVQEEQTGINGFPCILPEHAPGFVQRMGSAALQRPARMESRALTALA